MTVVLVFLGVPYELTLAAGKVRSALKIAVMRFPHLLLQAADATGRTWRKFA